jgi:group I intron endonuclease
MRTDSGVYSITNIVNGKVYIGSAKRFNFRWNTHRSFLRRGTHHSPHLQAAWNKYGESSFTFEKLLICSPENAVMYEQIMIDGHKAADRRFGYNARPTAESMLGFKQPPESIAKTRAANVGRKASLETRALLSRQRTGRKMPDWFGDFTRLHRTGVKHTPEARSKISAAGIGRPQSVSTREKRGKISADTAEAIRSELRKGGVTQTALATKYGVHQSTISLINSGTRWNLTSLGEAT